MLIRCHYTSVTMTIVGDFLRRFFLRFQAPADQGLNLFRDIGALGQEILGILPPLPQPGFLRRNRRRRLS